MSFVSMTPGPVGDAAQHLAGVHSSLAHTTSVVAAPTSGVAAAGQDEVSLAMASLFGVLGHQFQALSTQAQAFHAQFVGLMHAGVDEYVATEAAGRALLGGGI
jgi:hypothetical protein